MYLAGVSVRRVERITEAVGQQRSRPPPSSELNKKAYVHIEDWRNRPLQRRALSGYVYVDGICLRRRNWGGEYENVAILVAAVTVNEDIFVRFWVPPRAWRRTRPAGSVSSNGFVDAAWTA